CFQVLSELSNLRSGVSPMVPTLADIAWIAADEEETYARFRSDHRPLKHEWRPTPLLVLHRNSSVPSFRRDERKVETLKKPGLTALNRTTALQEELSRLRSQIARIVAADSDSAPLTPDLLSPDGSSLSCSMTSFETPFQPPATFLISDITEESEEAELELAGPSFSTLGSPTFEFSRTVLGERSLTTADEEEPISTSISKSSSFADMMDILKDINKVQMNKDW
uniref:Mitochondrial fission regulator n=2 Tax=Latimeria chalumnae TaxID=7897 RepID=H2ZRP1_LATCH